jgi:hypothetical protein
MRVLFYTALFGATGTLHEFDTRGYQFYCFTDEPRASKTWHVVRQPRHESPRLDAKWYKCCPPDNLPPHDVLIWIDASIELLDVQAFTDMCLAALGEKDIAFFRHPDRSDIYAEAAVSIEMPKYAGQLLTEQTEAYRIEGLPEHALWAGGVIVRRASSLAAQQLGSRWYHEIRRWSLQDQLSLPFALWKLDITPGEIQGSVYGTYAHRHHWTGASDESKQLHFTVTSTGINCTEWAERHIRSVQDQSYRHWQHIYIAADKNSARRAASFADTRSTVSFSPAESLENLWPIWCSLPDDEVIVWLDADDWFATSDTLLILADAYNTRTPKPWMTYGRFVWSTYPNFHVSPYFCTPYCLVPPREDVWRASHLKTFRAGLVKRIDPKDLRKPDGSWVNFCTDRFTMLPMLEMAGDNVECLSETLMVYNWSASSSGKPTHDVASEDAERLRVHSMPKYQRLLNRPW